MHRTSVELCPKCQSLSAVHGKKILIGAASPAVLFRGEEKAGYKRKDQFAVDECEPAALSQPPPQQFVEGWYCAKCDTGFVSDDIKKLG
jgi:hypothetical protein